MTDPVFPKFIQKKFSLRFNEEVFELAGLLSTQGITRIYPENEKISQALSLLTGSPTHIEIGTLGVKSVLEKQFSESGTFFEIRFLQMPDAVLDSLTKLVEKKGSSPGWHRLHPRIPVARAAESNIPVPNLCFMVHKKHDYYLNVVNFTLGGLRLETLNDSLADIKVGEIIHFDLITTNGEFMKGIEGEIRNIALHQFQDQSSVEVRRSFGVKLTKMSPKNETRFNDIIRVLCETLKKALDSY